MKNIEYQAEWEAEAKKLAIKSASRIWILASFVIPFFSLFEYSYGIGQFKQFLSIFICLSALMLISVLSQKKFPLPRLVQIYGVSVVLAFCFSYMATKTHVNNIHNYVMGISAITMVRGMIYFGKVIHLIIVTAINHAMAFIFLFVFRTESFKDIPEMGSTLFFCLIFMIFSFAGMNIRYKLTRENFINSLKLRHSLDLIEEKQKEILDSINYASRIQRALITSEKYIDKKLKELMGH